MGIDGRVLIYTFKIKNTRISTSQTNIVQIQQVYRARHQLQFNFRHYEFCSVGQCKVYEKYACGGRIADDRRYAQCVSTYVRRSDPGTNKGSQKTNQNFFMCRANTCFLFLELVHYAEPWMNRDVNTTTFSNWLDFMGIKDRSLGRSLGSRELYLDTVSKKPKLT